jgi:molecular chaperone HscB
LSQPLSVGSTDFELFGLPERFGLDLSELSRRWRDLQARIHPDRFAADGAAAQRVSMQWSVRVNEAYARLKDPLRRAAYLCELRGVPIDAERNTTMPAAFLVQQMQWREALDEADGPAGLEALALDVGRAWQTGVARLTAALDAQGDVPAAAQQVRALMFVERFRDDVHARLDALNA